jgi:hypothetical protein
MTSKHTSGVKVKPLEWTQEDNGDVIAESVAGWYHIGLPHETWSLTTPQGDVLSFDGLEAAKAAAQADYEARIRAALAPSDAEAGEAVRITDAMVEKAARALSRFGKSFPTIEDEIEWVDTKWPRYKDEARTALEAALKSINGGVKK